MKLNFTCILFLFIIILNSVSAQKVSKLTITDNLNTNSRFTLGKAKPAAPRDTFYLLSEKGTQVLFFAALQNSDSVSFVHHAVKFTAYKEINGKFEWVDDKVLNLKMDETYVMTAFNFFATGSFKIIITPEESSEILAQGVFAITK